MPSLFKIFALLALTAFSGVLAAPQPVFAVRRTVPDCNVATGFEMCLRSKTTRSLPESQSRERIPCSLTNAQRLARHLPLKPPTRLSSARRALASPVPASANSNRGYIQVQSVDANGNPSVVGYVSKTTYVGTQYVVSPSLDNALLVSPNGDRGLLTLNSDTPSPAFLGLVQGRDDTSSSLAQGSFNYLYLASSAQTSPNSTPQDVGNSFRSAYGEPYPAESAVWTVDPMTHSLTAQWINPDGSPAPTISFLQGSAIYFSGDPEVFHQMFGAPVQRIAFVYVPLLA
ncbi:hypothetical protein B0H17DRAFT_1043504 [Mycena rosella]|uniref:Uncharacterized protein n=1 Tax=Mycena rosella TaxID=1033263 RepID=A0AAD7DYX9_MYCRO|nr:hypothetical protein B0H17DRAFT_1043504 [Mycena rosella]